MVTMMSAPRMSVYRFVPPGGSPADEIIWDVTTLLAGAAVGALGPPLRFPIRLIRLNAVGPGVEREAVERLKRDRPPELDVPVLLVDVMASAGVVHRVFVDGNHRAVARAELGRRDFEAFVVGPDVEGRYRVTNPALLRHLRQATGEAPPAAGAGRVIAEPRGGK